MASKEYSELLKDPRWQKRKTEIMIRDNYTCQCCGCTNKTLHVHHKYYDGRKPWEYEDDALITLCEDCHSREHGVTIPKFGEVYETEHSDYTNYMVCYGVNYHSGAVYLFGMDTGSSNYDIYFYNESIENFKERYTHIDNFWNGLYNGEEDSYIPSVLLNMMVNVSLYGNVNPNYYSYNVFGFEYNDKDVVTYAKSKIMDLIGTNENLLNRYRDIIC